MKNQTPLEKLYNELEVFESLRVDDIQSIIHKGGHQRQLRLLVRGEALEYIKTHYPNFRRESGKYTSPFIRFVLPKEYSDKICGD